jgi:hypothetical protein
VNGLDDDNGIVDDNTNARIMANNVSMLIEKPNICKKKKSSDDRYGYRNAGIKVDLKSCNK